jgi:PAS domain S-box-containing protein
MFGPSLLVAVPSVLVFFMLALITWYFAHTLEQSNRAMSDANVELTKELAERKRTEADLRLMSHVVEQSPVSIALMSKEGQLVYVNRRFLEMTGHSPEEAKRLTWGDMQPPEAGPDTDTIISATLAAGKEWRAQTRRTRPNDEGYWEAVSISLVHDAGSDTEHYLAMAEDVTVRQEAEDALRNMNSELERRVEERTTELLRANIALERSARLKDEFLATMSHELRTPLTGILGAADVLSEQVNGALNPRQLRSVQSIVGSGQHLLALINGILDLSKIEAGGMKVEPQPLDVDHACKNALTVVREQAGKKTQAISFTSRPANMQLEADPIRLKQMLVNLLSNAVKFTPEGGRIGLDAVGDAENNKIHFTVWDTGIGIQAEEMPRLFEPFVQLDSGLKRKYGGTGLGLTLVRKFAEMHGGGVAVESSLGEGSKFTISLPWDGWGAAEAKTDVAAGEPVTLTPYQLKGGRKPLILLAEDSQPSIDTVLSFLEPLGCDVLVVQRGDEAVQYTIERRPNLVLMDIQMPYLDGVAAIRQIRAHADPSVAATPIVALTALAMRGDRERCLAAGADEYLSKPFTLRAFTQMVCDLLSRSQAAT